MLVMGGPRHHAPMMLVMVLVQIVAAAAVVAASAGDPPGRLLWPRRLCPLRAQRATELGDARCDHCDGLQF